MTTTQTITSEQQLLRLPVVCLATANFDLTVQDVVQGKATVIDIWTTRCTRCPAALDKLNEMASSDNDNANSDNRIQFVSICCDKLDGAREILDRDSTSRWNNMRHFFMDHEHKERAKQLLGFKQVPFYLVFDDTGAMLFSGSKLPNLVDLLNRKKKEESTLLSTPLPTSKTTSASSSPSDVFATDFDELDF